MMLIRPLAALALAIAVVAFVPAPAHAAPDERSAPVVREVTFEGLVRVSEEGLRRRISSQVGTRLDRDRVADDLKRIFRMDYFEDVRIEVEDRTDGIAVVFVVKERPAIRGVRIEGNDEVDLEDIQKVVDIPPYEIVNVPKINVNLQKIREVYRDQGFYLADVTYELVPLAENMVDLVFRIRERAKIEVKRITFLGNRALTDDQLRDAMMGTKEGGFFSFLTRSGMFKREYFEQDLRILKDFYAQHGYIAARIDDPVVSLSRDQKSLYITIHVVEGRRFRVGTVGITGDIDDETREKLLPKLVLKPGEVFSSANVRADTQLVGGEYRNQGYAYANVSSDYEMKEPEGEAEGGEPAVDFTYVVQKGLPVHFGKVMMAGNDSTSDRVLRRELIFAEGDLYSEAALERSRARIYRLGFFEKVELKTQRGLRDDVVDVVVEVTERQTGTFQVGAGFSSLESFIATAQISKQNFLGRGQTLSFQAMLSSIRSLFMIQFYEPHFFDSQFTFSLDLYNYQQDFDDFSRASTGTDVTFGYWITDEFLVSLSYKLEQVEASRGGSDDRTPPLANLFDDGITSSLRLGFAYDSRDNRLFPTNGWYATASVEHAAPYFGSQNEFTRLSARVTRYFPLWLGMVLKLNGTTGWVFSERPEGVPIFERYFVGGIFTVRGFRRNSLGPTVYTGCERGPDARLCGFNIGGNKQLIFNAEIEFPIFDPVGIKGVVFVDAGNAFDDGEAFNPLDLRSSWGLGIRWNSPMGPLRFEWGFPFRPKEGEDRYVFEFTIGNAF